MERFGFRGLRCSTRPDAIDGEVLSLLKAYHMVAVELGAQSMDGEVLRRNRRGHSPEDTVRAAGLIRAAGLELGLQMMTGLYGSTPEKGVNAIGRLLLALKKLGLDGDSGQAAAFLADVLGEETRGEGLGIAAHAVALIETL